MRNCSNHSRLDEIFIVVNETYTLYDEGQISSQTALKRIEKLFKGELHSYRHYRQITDEEAITMATRKKTELYIVCDGYGNPLIEASFESVSEAEKELFANSESEQVDEGHAYIARLVFVKKYDVSEYTRLEVNEVKLDE
jgi:hypothetical protein